MSPPLANSALAPIVTVHWDEVGQKAWADLADHHPYTAYQQHFSYGAIMATLGGQGHRVAVRHEGALVGVAQVQTRRFAGLFSVATILRGPLWAADLAPAIKQAGMAALAASVPVAKPYIVLVTPEAADASDAGLAGVPRVMGGYHTVLIDLTQPEDALRAGLNGKWRNRLKAAEKSDLTVTRMGRRPAQYGWILTAEEQQQAAMGYRALPTQMVPTFQDMVGADAVMGVEAKLGGERAGGMLFLRHGTAATYHIGWASEAGKAANAHNLLLWSAMVQLQKKGVRTLDLGGVSTDHGAGIARFKLGTGGQVTSLAGTYLFGPKLF